MFVFFLAFDVLAAFRVCSDFLCSARCSVRGSMRFVGWKGRRRCRGGGVEGLESKVQGAGAG